jgi:hypothetical protein
MPVIMVNKVVDNKRIIRKRGPRSRRGTRSSRPPKNIKPVKIFLLPSLLRSTTWLHREGGTDVAFISCAGCKACNALLYADGLPVAPKFKTRSLRTFCKTG